MSVSYAEAIAQCAEHIAKDDSHGYSQPNRKGHGREQLKFSDGTPYSVHRGDYDCSEMARQCAEAAGLLSPDSYMWTGNEDAVLKGAGFKTVALGSKRRGDILWKPGHTGIYLGGGLMADAHGDEYGGIAGPREGDQTGREIEVRPVSSCSWDRCYRPPSGTVPASATEEPDIRRGIDVSNWDGDGGAEAIRDTSCGFVIVKASEGADFRDVYAKANADAAHGAGKLLGFYHYAGESAPETEAAWFVACCDSTGHLDEATLWLDIEERYAAVPDPDAWCSRFIEEVERLTGKTVGLYSYKSFINENGGFPSCSTRPLWGAQYATDDPAYGWQDDPWQSSQPWGAWGDRLAIHQYSGNGYVPGYGGALDLDRGYFDRQEWEGWAGGSPAPDPDLPQDRGYSMIDPVTLRFVTAVNVRDSPSLSGERVDLYRFGESVTVDGLAVGEGFVWGHYVGASSGEDRWVALGRTDFVEEE